ncbi:OmpA family protein [Hymenobacter setariae]|uniref:OmpA family protein n=1 Tax=Hymenobacter setariae TaxID=2594794 RepID=A0A558BVG7_9BACT|nr:OmpA family protein [Hymenobacter setariae]TVT40520.1 OmpA family protein [Hymenobacter setariae]
MNLPLRGLLAAALLLGSLRPALAQLAPDTLAQTTAGTDTLRLAQRLTEDEEEPATASTLPVAPMPVAVTEITLHGTVLDVASGKPVAASIDVLDNENGSLVTTLHCTPEGSYSVNLPAGTNYGLVLRNSAYPFHSENVNLASRMGFPETVRNFRLQKLEPGTNILLNNVFFEPGTAKLRPESTAELERLLKLLGDKPKLKVKISSHSDGTGDYEEGVALTKRRAQVIAAYLTEHKIKTERLTVMGYGASIPLRASALDGDRLRNQRTEFRVLAN